MSCQLSLESSQNVKKRHTLFTVDKAPPTRSERGFAFNNSLTMTYFHTGIRTIIGAKSFHCPVRDGKEWDQLAMVIRLKGALLYCVQQREFIELIEGKGGD